jgi:hypothetical protein
MKKLTLLAVALLAFGSGCVHREIVGFADHETKPLTALQVNVKRSYLVSSTQEYVFYSCSEQGDKLTCKRLCGGGNDVVCPTASTSGNGYTTNIR